MKNFHLQISSGPLFLKLCIRILKCAEKIDGLQQPELSQATKKNEWESFTHTHTQRWKIGGGFRGASGVCLHVCADMWSLLWLHMYLGTKSLFVDIQKKFPRIMHICSLRQTQKCVLKPTLYNWSYNWTGHMMKMVGKRKKLLWARTFKISWELKVQVRWRLNKVVLTGSEFQC